MYRFQYGSQNKFAEWSEWRPLTQPINEAVILNVYFTDDVTDTQKKEFLKRELDMLQ